MGALDPSAPELASLREPYEAQSPDGADHWPVVAAKVAEMGRTGPTMALDDIRSLTMPALVMAGDDDIVSHGHTVELFEALPQGQLAILPGTSHALPAEKPELLVSLILAFLTGGPPERIIPIRFAPSH
jgi:pimeloyl-ACP methyl ester carboxylesterase